MTYVRAVISEFLPLTDLEVNILELMGFTVEKNGDTDYHIYSNEYHATVLVNDASDKLRETYGWDILSKYCFTQKCIDLYALLQEVLKRTGLEDVLVETAHTLDINKPEKLGGSVTRITRDRIQYMSTFNQVQTWRDE